MATKDDPNSVIKAADAKEIMDRYHAQAVVVILVRDDGVVDTATYGRNEGACAVIARWRDGLMSKLPVSPFQTWFGWGNGGRAKRLTPAEYATLNDQQKAYVDINTHPKAV